MRSSIVLISAFLIYTSCVTIKPLDTSCVTYKSSELSIEEMNNFNIAILPVLEGEGFEGFRRLTGEELTKVFRVTLSSDKVLSPIQTLNSINDANLTEEYSDLIEDYNRSAILNKQTLKMLGEALGCRYLIYSKVGHSEDYVVISTGYGYTRYDISEANIYTQVWDTQLGDIVWEGIGGGAAIEGSEGSDLNSLISLAALGLSNRIGKSSNETPPCQTSKLLKDQVSSNYTATILAVSGISLIVSLIILAAL